jgi:hypothetical protein
MKMNVNDVVTLHGVMNSMKEMPKNPIKFCLIRNLKKTEIIKIEFENYKDEIFQSTVKIDENGLAVISEEFKDKIEDGSGVPYEFFEYNSEESKKEFFNKVNDKLREEVEIELSKESLSRVIRVSSEDGKYNDSTIEEVLSDPLNGLDVNTLTYLMENILID